MPPRSLAEELHRRGLDILQLSRYQVEAPLLRMQPCEVHFRRGSRRTADLPGLDHSLQLPFGCGVLTAHHQHASQIEAQRRGQLWIVLALGALLSLKRALENVP